ncbi:MULTISPECIES: hypothetical protein [unclassified Myxococcus]|uniref:hypothetical protein n=1 Tax=unclassified Myxococcus TaxID=2648731 RepID=UPI001CBC56D6|nr:MULTISPECIES: hypothetical protein [unclassified Myxococcus]MBZ4400412.1 hypothetical protein [Myxococcus sp. AS-1-15]MBZ4410892.1 hypothetical protein [Myxococcus sp. XM-1-1-1]
MRETIEFRIPERHAARLLEPGLGVRLDESTRKVVLPIADQRVQAIGRIERSFNQKGTSFFLGWSIHRRYTEDELQSAELLNLVIRAYFEPPGSMCGTEYDDAVACQHCGAGAPMKTPLILNTRRVPKNKDIAQTIAGEVVVSPRFVAAFQEHGLLGAEFRPVLHQGRKGPQPSELSQLVVTSRPLKLTSRTVAGNNPFDLDARNEHRCPKGHLAGLNQLSELYVEHASHDGSDICLTDKMFGDRRGELRPEPRLLISPKLRDVLTRMQANGFLLELAHFE